MSIAESTTVLGGLDEGAVTPTKDPELSPSERFDAISDHINSTIDELNIIYNQIGYTGSEISIKKAEIFSVIEDTIAAFTGNLRREKNNIENECEWLRQQIRIILAMVNDATGEKCLKRMDRGIVFNDTAMYEEGYKEDVLNKLSTLQNRLNFFAYSPFNDSEIHDDVSLENQYEYMMKNIPVLLLLQLKHKLNDIFLDVLKTFVRTYKRLNASHLQYLELTETIGDYHGVLSNVTLLKSLPSKEEAEEHRELIDKFDYAIKNLKPSDKQPQDHNAFIISSPRKHEPVQNDTMDVLRDLNYQIVRVIRGLKLTKITPDTVTSLQKEIDVCEEEVAKRTSDMKSLIGNCIDLISTLHLTEEQLMKIQRQHDLEDDGHFDMETLKFIHDNPREFGLMVHHVEFVKRLAQTLKKMRDSKQKKWDYYLDACTRLWDKLGESRDHVETFLNANSLLTDISIMNFKMELNRLFLKRSEFIEGFIVDARDNIEQLWAKMFYSSAQKAEFKHFTYNVSDETLDKELVYNEHEMEVQRLQAEYEQKRPILELYGQVTELVDDQKFLVESSKDSSRLLSKNSCKILLNEEKIRKKINKNMPKLLEQLKTEIVKYNDAQMKEEKRAMTINGEDFFERVLLIESETLNQKRARPGQRPGQVRPARASPPKVSQSLRSLPVRRTNVRPGMRGPSPKVAPRSSRPAQSAPVSRVSPKKPLQLQPLNSPLKAYDATNENTVYSSMSRLSPLRINQQPEMLSPTSEDKENDQFSLSPIKVIPTDKDSDLADSSTIIGDDYQLWRDERIRQLNL